MPLGIFECMSLINTQGHTEHFLKRTYLEIAFFRGRGKRNCIGSLRNFVTFICNRDKQIYLTKYNRQFQTPARRRALYLSEKK